MDAALFRPNAIDARRRRAAGEPFEAAPLGADALAAAATAILVIAAVLISVVEIPRRATVHGYLAPEHGLIRVRAPAFGTVMELAVGEGDEVSAGQVLLRLEDRRSTRDAPDVAASTRRDLAALRGELTAQRRLVQTSLEAELVRLAHQRDALGRELDALTAQLDAARERATVADRRLQELTPIAAQGLLPAAQLLQQRDRVSELRLDALRIEQQLLERSRQHAELEAERGARGRQSRTRIAELDAALARQALESLGADQQHDRVLRAPTAGRVLRVAVHEGATVQAGQTTITLAPGQAPLQAVLLVPSRDAGMLAPGQQVVVRLDAFPYQRFGTRRATVLKVGASVVLPGEGEAPVPLAEPAFEVFARLETERIEAYGQRWPLRTDLTFEADVVLERATLLERLLDPLRAFARRDG